MNADNLLEQYKQGDAWAAYHLGIMSYTNMNQEEALKYFQAAKDRKHSMAQEMIDKIKLELEQAKTEENKNDSLLINSAKITVKNNNKRP